MRTNVPVKTDPIYTHEGAKAQHIDAYRELQRTLMTCLLFEDTFYEKGSSIAARIAELVPRVEPEKVMNLAIESRSRMQLRHAPLFVLRELARVKGAGAFVATGLSVVIQRADELSEFLALYWKEKKQPLSAGVKRGLAAAFRKFDAYRLAKYNRDNAIKLRDVLFLVHGKPGENAVLQSSGPKGPVPAISKGKYKRGPVYRHITGLALTWKQLIDGTLVSPDTWEVELSAGKDKKETFERLMREGKLGGLALLRNLRNMQKAGVSDSMIRERLAEGAARALPFRFVTAARYAPTLEDAIEVAMLKSIEDLPTLSGKTGLLIDVSGSMDAAISDKSEVSRIDAASGLAILLREKAVSVKVATFSHEAVEIAPRRGFALRDAINNSQAHGGTYLQKALVALQGQWHDLDRLIVITDEQSHDGIGAAFTPKAYCINVAPYANGVSYGNGWHHIDGWSERVLDYIRELESESDSE